MSGREKVLGIAALIAFVTVASQGTFLWTRGLHTPITDPDDFRAFYCAGRLTIGGADPYRTEPLRSCEHAAAADFGLTIVPSKFVLPAPLPPYALLAFGPLGALPFPAASTLWFSILITSMVVSIIAIVRLARVAPIVATGAIVLSSSISVGEGQLAPLITAALCVAAWAARAGRPRVVGVGLAVAMLEPHIGLPALLCACIDTRLRSTALAIAAVAVGASLVPGGPLRMLEYVSRVLPAHARSEVDWYAQQFSLTTTLWALGVPRALATAFGAMDYAAMAMLGVFIAIRLCARFADRAFLILVPSAFVALGGSFIHIFQIETSVPLAFLSFSRMTRWRVLLAFAIVGLAIPTQYFINESPLADVFTLPPKIVPYVSKPWNVEALQLAEDTEMEHTGAGRIERPDLHTELLALTPKFPTWIALICVMLACVGEAAGCGHARERNAAHGLRT